VGCASVREYTLTRTLQSARVVSLHPRERAQADADGNHDDDDDSRPAVERRSHTPVRDAAYPAAAKATKTTTAATSKLQPTAPPAALAPIATAAPITIVATSRPLFRVATSARYPDPRVATLPCASVPE
jgi:hypothetical protein